MRIFKGLFMTAILLGANAVSAQSADSFAGQSGMKNQPATSLSGSEINYDKSYAGRRYRCPEFCS